MQAGVFGNAAAEKVENRAGVFSRRIETAVEKFKPPQTAPPEFVKGWQ
jgi:hypothetical protein